MNLFIKEIDAENLYSNTESFWQGFAISSVFVLGATAAVVTIVT